MDFFHRLYYKTNLIFITTKDNSDMKMITQTLTIKYLAGWLSLLFIVFNLADIKAQANCDVTKVHGLGYSTTIKSVINNSGNIYTITLSVKHDGCPGPVLKELSNYAVEAKQGTYSNVSVAVISGSMTYTNINMGPYLSGVPFNGFKIEGIDNIGEGQPENLLLPTLYLMDFSASRR